MDEIKIFESDVLGDSLIKRFALLGLLPGQRFGKGGISAMAFDRRFKTAAVVAAMGLSGLAQSALAAETITYTYDVHGRVTNVAHSGSVNNGLNVSYSYDAADNRTNVTTTGSPH